MRGQTLRGSARPPIDRLRRTIGSKVGRPPADHNLRAEGSAFRRNPIAVEAEGDALGKVHAGDGLAVSDEPRLTINGVEPAEILLFDLA